VRPLFYAIFLYFSGFFLETGIAVVFYIVFKLATKSGCVTLSLLVLAGCATMVVVLWFNFPSIIVAFIHENSKSSYAQNLFCFKAI
jgi:type IV secretory pathway VirB3-like protein